ncbi:helix-hairpin-helix domain-containing protein [Anaerosporobacter faecicola]|uniref:helix-hairpin-helix domain-containing protein n=1 Tax=Anaerosporobacter faecicola TaxID=2718714 RepID=UPI00143BDF35|nr:helix-hairpin-helix domain-containing protein [Anaerosporobacter faecicola]
MNKKQIVNGVIGIVLIGVICIICYKVFYNAGASDIIITDGKEESEKEAHDSNEQDSELETSMEEGYSVEEQGSENKNFEKQDSEEQYCIAVHVCGQVKKPGVYTLAQGARVNEAIEAAGGLTKKAAGEAVNQAEMVKDEQQIYVPSKEEMKDSSLQLQKETGYSENHLGNKQLVNINQATRDELMTLPGIGEAKADMIIAYRNEHGEFATIEEIKKISGIKDGVYNKICDLITTD